MVISSQRVTLMERTRFLQHYRIRLRSDGMPYELNRNGAATTYEALDDRTGEPVSLKLIPSASIDPGAREQFEEQASAAQKLRHVNVAKVFDFGREGDDYVYVSERLPGETLAGWVRSHGPMPADAALRVAEQIVSVLSSARFHKLPYPSIEPSDIIVVPGQTPEGNWPLVKSTNFGLPGITADPEQLVHGTTDIRSEVYSLGATLYFLVTDIAPSSERLLQARDFAGFPKPLRILLAGMLHRDPNQRPKDLVVLAEMIRESLLKIERRRLLADKYGIPFRTIIPRRAEARPGRLLWRGLAVGALLLAAAVIAAVLLREPIGKIAQRTRETKGIGVLIGVPESSPASAFQNTSTAIAPASVKSQGPNANMPLANQQPGNAATASNSQQVATQDLKQTQTSSTQAQVAAPNASGASSSGAILESSSQDVTKSSVQPGTAAQPTTASQANSRSKKKTVASSSRRARGAEGLPEDWPPRRNGSMRGRVVGITSDGRLIYRLRSGRTAIVAPDSEEEQFMPRGRRRVLIERDEETFAPPPRFAPDYFPYD
jgi:serine/threonine protein kinase